MSEHQKAFDIIERLLQMYQQATISLDAFQEDSALLNERLNSMENELQARMEDLKEEKRQHAVSKSMLESLDAENRMLKEKLEIYERFKG